MAERPRAYGRPQPRTAGRITVETSLRADAYEGVQAVMERHNITASGAVHHLVRIALGIKPLEDF
jgi:hypothetical protein